MNSKKKIMILIFLILGITSVSVSVQAKVSPRLNKKSVVLLVGQSVAVKVKNTDQSVRWISNDENTAIVKNGIVTGIKKGMAVVTAIVGDDSFDCKVKVVKQYSINAIKKYLNRYLEKHYDEWKYVFFDSETRQYEGKYIFTIRNQGGNMANILAGNLSVDPLTGKAVFEPIDGLKKVKWKIF